MDCTPEITQIPVTGFKASVGAMGYMAVLAYPNWDDRPKRNNFIEAFKADICKGYMRAGMDRRKILPIYRGMKNEKINGILSRGLYRIQAFRIPAARMAWWKMINGQKFGPIVKGTRETILTVC
jgi:hypothetical protein